MSRAQVERTSTLGKILTQIRLEAKMTTKQVSEASNVSSTLISGYERGVIEPRYHSLEKVLDVFGYEIEIVRK